MFSTLVSQDAIRRTNRHDLEKERKKLRQKTSVGKRVRVQIEVKSARRRCNMRTTIDDSGPASQRQQTAEHCDQQASS